MIQEGLFPEPKHAVPSSRVSPVASGQQWSGPMVGQTVMGVKDLSAGRSVGPLSPGESPRFNAGGYTHSSGEEHRHYYHDEHGNVDEGQTDRRSYGPMHERNVTLNKYEAANSYGRDRPRQFGQLTQFPTNAITHTAQPAWDTADTGENGGNVSELAEQLRQGDTIKEPIQIAKMNGRNYVLDGHHRLAAARTAGLSTIPAYHWDADKSHEKGEW
jgi:hypothetical protein